MPNSDYADCVTRNAAYALLRKTSFHAWVGVLCRLRKTAQRELVVDRAIDPGSVDARIQHREHFVEYRLRRGPDALDVARAEVE